MSVFKSNGKSLFAILLLSASFVVGCGLLFRSLDSTDSHPFQHDAKTLIYGNAVVEAKFRCQQMVLTASLHARGENVPDVINTILTKLDALPQQIRSQGSALVFYHLKDLHVSALRNNKGDHKGYAKFEMMFEDFDSADQVLSRLEQLGFSKFKNVRYQLLHQDEIIAQLSQQAYEKAKQNAQRTAAQKHLAIRRMNRYSYDSNRESAYPDPVARIRLDMKASFWTNELNRSR